MSFILDLHSTFKILPNYQKSIMLFIVFNSRYLSNPFGTKVFVFIYIYQLYYFVAKSRGNLFMFDLNNIIFKVYQMI